MSQKIIYPKQCPLCGNDYDVEVEITTENQWKEIQRDIWTKGTCPQCDNTGSYIEE